MTEMTIDEHVCALYEQISKLQDTVIALQIIVENQQKREEARLKEELFVLEKG